MDSEAAVEIIGKFFPQEWANSSRHNVSFTKITCGYINSVWVVENSTAGHVEPKKLLLRKYGGNTLDGYMKQRSKDESYFTNSETDEVLIIFLNSKLSWGPQLYGVFEGGRVEEFVESHTLTHAEASQPQMIKDIAIAYARHSTLGNQLPLPRDKMIQRRAYLRKISLTWKQDIQEQKLDIQRVFEEAGVDLEPCLSKIDYVKEVEWIIAIMNKTSFKLGLVNMDTNYLNVLVREEVKAGEHPIVLIDYEMAYYGPRAYDIAGHWTSRMITWNDKKNKVNGHKFPPEKERQAFVKEYLKEIERLNPNNFNNNGLDTEEAVMKEADIGVLQSCLSASLGLMTKAPRLTAEPSFVTVVPMFQDLFLRHKEKCLKKYPEWSAN